MKKQNIDYVHPNPIIELLAIKLYEHDFSSGFPPNNVTGWIKLNHEDKQSYYDIATGSRAYTK